MVYAAGVGDVIGTINPGPMGNLTFTGVVSWAVSLIFFVAGMFALVQLVLGGLDWVGSGGEEKKLESARKRIMAAAIGIIMTIVVFAGWYFVVGPILGIFKNGLIQLPTVNSICVGPGNTAATAADCCSGRINAGTCL
jgi:hypothetical protein